MGNVISQMISPISDVTDNIQEDIVCNEFIDEERKIYSHVGEFHTYENI
jgi:hypothetical protein